MGLSPEKKKLKLKILRTLLWLSWLKIIHIGEDAMNALSKMGSGMYFQGVSHFTVNFKLAFMMVCTSSAVNTVNSFPL